MHIDNLSLSNFRNYEYENFSFSPNTNIIYGLNGQGKTNVIEALYFFCSGKSYRTNKENEIIKFGKEEAKININFFDDKRENISEIIINTKKIVKINGLPITKLSEIIGMINFVIFTPDMLNIVKEGPSMRRQFVDVLTSQLKPYYFKNLMSYYKVLFHRNNILKSNNKKMLSTIDVWNEKLADYGTVVCKYRNNIIKLLNENFDILDGINKNEKIEFKYISSIKEEFENKEFFLKQLEKEYEKEIEKGITLIGPHRDDIDILMNEKSIKKYGSQGQIRTCVLKLKLAECEIIKKELGRNPILLLDDILSELDEKRKSYFINKIKDKQIFITCTEKEKITTENVKYFKINNGKLINEGMN